MIITDDFYATTSLGLNLILPPAFGVAGSLALLLT